MAGCQGDMMKINAEKLFLVIFVVILSAYSTYFISPGPDIYAHYAVAKEILKDTSIIWRANLTGWQSFVAIQTSALTNYPPLAYIAFAVLMSVQLPLFLMTIFCVAAIGYFLYKIDGKSIPFLFMSFMFVREAAFNGYDIILVAVTLTSFYFLAKKKIVLSAIFVGMLPLIKSTGLFVVLSWLLYIILFEMGNIFTKRFIVAIIIALSLSSPFYIRNYLMFHDVLLAVLGISRETYARGTEFLSSAFQINQPERFLWDSTGYYPLPIDILFYVGIVLFAFNLIKTRQIRPYSILIIVMVGAYFIFQLIGIPFFVIRHEMIIFPFLALEIVRGIPEKYLKHSLIICLLFLTWFSFNLSKYAFNQYSGLLGPTCNQLRTEIGNEPVYVTAFHSWFVIYRCNLNATVQADSKWTADFDKGQLYPTNHTNIAGA